MQAENDRRKLTVSREEDNQRDFKNVNSRLGFTSGQSSADGNESNQIFDSDSSWGNISGEEGIAGGQGTTGKMLRQLRDLKDAHLAYIDSHKQLLESQLEANAEHRDKILECMNRLEGNMLKLLGEEVTE